MRQFNTLTGFLLSKSSNPSVNDIVEFSGYDSAGDGGGAQWKHNGVTAQTPSQSPAQLGDALLNDGNGNQWGLIIESITPSFESLGGGVSKSANTNLLVLLAFTSAMDGKPVGLGSGTYNIEFSSATALTKMLYAKGKGKLLTTINLVQTTAAFSNAFALTAGITLSKLSLTITPNGQDFAFFGNDVSNISLFDCLVDGNVTNVGSVISHNCYIINVPSTGVHSNVKVHNTDLTRYTYGILKTNVATSSQSDIEFYNVECSFYYKNAISINSPSGVVKGFQVLFCKFRDGAGIDAGEVNTHSIAMASVNDFSISMCEFHGKAAAAIHIEEKCVNGNISGNIIHTEAGSGITLQDNLVGGLPESPENIIISNNILNYGGVSKEGVHKGISLIFDFTAEVPAKRAIVSNNIVNNYNVGYVSGAKGGDSCEIRSNIAHNCESAYSLAGGASHIEGNTSSNCVIAVLSKNGGYPINHKITECQTALLAVTRDSLMINPSYQWDEFNTAGGETTNKPMFPLSTGSRVNATISISGFEESSSNDTSIKVYDVTWDGVSFVATQKSAIGSGSMVVSIVNNVNQLTARVFTGGVATKIKLSVIMTGTLMLENSI